MTCFSQEKWLVFLSFLQAGHNPAFYLENKDELPWASLEEAVKKSDFSPKKAASDEDKMEPAAPAITAETADVKEEKSTTKAAVNEEKEQQQQLAPAPRGNSRDFKTQGSHNVCFFLFFVVLSLSGEGESCWYTLQLKPFLFFCLIYFFCDKRLFSKFPYSL